MKCEIKLSMLQKVRLGLLRLSRSVDSDLGGGGVNTTERDETWSEHRLDEADGSKMR